MRYEYDLTTLTSSSLAHEAVVVATATIFKFSACLSNSNTVCVPIWLAILPSTISGRTAVEPVLSRRRRVCTGRRELVQTDPTVHTSAYKRQW